MTISDYLFEILDFPDGRHVSPIEKYSPGGYLPARVQGSSVTIYMAEQQGKSSSKKLNLVWEPSSSSSPLSKLFKGRSLPSWVHQKGRVSAEGIHHLRQQEQECQVPDGWAEGFPVTSRVPVSLEMKGPGGWRRILWQHSDGSIREEPWERWCTHPRKDKLAGFPPR